MNEDKEKLLNQLLEEKRQRELKEQRLRFEKEENMINEYSIDYIYNHPVVTSLVNKVVNFIKKTRLESSSLSIEDHMQNCFKELDRTNLNELIE